MIVSFAFPSPAHRVGGVIMIYEFANALARRGHEVHFIHGPKWPNRVDEVGKLPFRFEGGVQHHFVDSLADPGLPDGDVVFAPAPERLGQPAVLVQGFRLIGPEWDRATFRAAAPKICVAGWLVGVGRSFGAPEEQLVHVPMGIDHELFAVRTPYDRRPIDVATLYHPSREKGWKVARATLAKLAERPGGLRAVVFSLAGSPPEPLPDGVQVVLDLDQRALADRVYNAAKVVMQASYHEGFGLVALEAMACGAALVTTDCGGSRDYARQGETAYVVAAGDDTGLAEGVDALLSNEHLRRTLAAAGSACARRFNWDRSGELLEAFLARYLADPTYFQLPPGEDRSEEYAL